MNEQPIGLRPGMGAGGDSDSISITANPPLMETPPPPADYEPQLKEETTEKDTKDVWHGWPKAPGEE